jgi:hypothetical protein
MFDVENPQGGTPYGAGCLAGPTGARQPNEHEPGYAKHQVGHVCTCLYCLNAHASGPG